MPVPLSGSTDDPIVREAIWLSRRAGNYVFLPIAVAGFITLVLLQGDFDPRASPASSSLAVMLGSVVAAAFVLWRLSRRPRPILLLICGVAIGFATVVFNIYGYKALRQDLNPHALLHFALHASGMGLMTVYCIRMWWRLRRFSSDDLETLERAVSAEEHTPPPIPSTVPSILALPGVEMTPPRIVLFLLLIPAMIAGAQWMSRREAMAARRSLLREPGSAFGLSPATPSDVWGVLMERGTAEGSDSFTILANGFISLRTFPEGEVRYPAGDTGSLRQSVVHFVEVASRHAAQGERTGSEREPESGEVLFFLLIDDGKRVISGRETDFRRAHPFSALYAEGAALALELQKHFGLPAMYSYTDPPRFYRACDFSK